MSKTLRNSVLWIGVVVGALWLVKYFSETEMRRLDKEVDRLCAIDGRSVIYEAVKLPANKFNSHGQPMVPQNDKDDTGFGYYIQGGQANTRWAWSGPRRTPHSDSVESDPIPGREDHGRAHLLHPRWRLLAGGCSGVGQRQGLPWSCSYGF